VIKPRANKNSTFQTSTQIEAPLRIPSAFAMAANRILLFGDSADAPVALIRELLAKSQHSKNTQLFIQNAVEAVGREIQTLPPPERDAMGMIHSIQDLQDCYESKRDPFGIAQAVLLFVARIGNLILYVQVALDMFILIYPEIDSKYL
jgi:hypothetical protein